MAGKMEVTIASISMGSHHGTGQDDGQIVFKTATDVHSTTNGLQERARILSTGGLTFNGDVAQANALDDYEEGSWTPTLAKAGTSGTVASPNNAFGSYSTQKFRVGFRSTGTKHLVHLVQRLDSGT